MCISKHFWNKYNENKHTNTSTAVLENSFLQNSTWKKAFVFTPAVTINIPSLFLCYFNPIGYSVREHTELRASFILKFASLFILFCLSKVKIDSVWLEKLNIRSGLKVRAICLKKKIPQAESAEKKIIIHDKKIRRCILKLLQKIAASFADAQKGLFSPLHQYVYLLSQI